MLGISRRSPHIEEAWQLAKELYLSAPAAQRLYETNGIISPAKTLWSQSFYDRPEPYFSNQAVGRMYIDMAPDVPARTSSPHNKFAKHCFRDAVVALRQYARSEQVFEPEQLYDEAKRQLDRAQEDLGKQIHRNVFLSDGLQGDEP